VRVAATRKGYCVGCGKPTRFWISWVEVPKPEYVGLRPRWRWEWCCPNCLLKKKGDVLAAKTVLLRNPPQLTVEKPKIVDTAFFPKFPAILVMLVKDAEGNLYLSPMGKEELRLMAERMKTPVPDDVRRAIEKFPDAIDLVKGILFVVKDPATVKQKVLAVSAEEYDLALLEEELGSYN